MSDESEQFLIAIYELCLAAELARLCVEIHSHSDKHYVGVPAVQRDSPRDPPSGGWPGVIEIERVPITLDDIACCTIIAPPR
jgi:hypothetical protein